MANIPIYPGSSSFFPSGTPFGFYDNDIDFQTDADKVALFCARRLGYPIMDVELQDVQFYTAFEEAITEYGNEVYAWKVRQDYLDIEGSSTGSNLNNALITPSMANIIRLSEQYGSEIGSGGNVDWLTGSVALTSSIQTYDLDAWAISNGISGSGIEIKRIFYEPSPAILKYFDPYAGTGTGTVNLLDGFGWGSYSPAINFTLMPISFDLQKIQGIELNDQIRKANFSFELINNKLRVFPIPRSTGNLFFHYIKKDERLSSVTAGSNSGSVITNISNVPYQNPNYTQTNSIGRAWIFEYTLALCKEMLGYVRGKYNAIPIPNSDTQLNSPDLLSSAQNDKDRLITKLRDYLDDTSRDKSLERKKNESEYKRLELSNVPFMIYVG